MAQKMKPIIIERVIYCIQFASGTETVKLLDFEKIFQSSDKTIKDLSRVKLEIEKIENLEKNWLCLKQLVKRNTDFHITRMKIISTKLRIRDTEKVFICLQVNTYFR